MNASDLLSYIFDWVDGTFTVFWDDSETECSTSNIPQNIADATLIELLLTDKGTVVGVPTPDPALATFRLVKGDRVVNVALFKVPVPEIDVPQDIETLLIPLRGWEAEIVTDTFYTFDQVFGASGGVTENDIGSESGEKNYVAPADAGGDFLEKSDAPDDVSLEDSSGSGETGDEATSRPEPAGATSHAERDAGCHTPSGEGGSSGETAEASEGASGEPAPAGPQLLNDAEIRGTDSPLLADFLAKDASFMIGEMWGMRDRRNTQDKDWKTTTMTWGAWAGGGESTKNAPAWGFSRHPVGKDKAGPCVVLGSSVGGARKAKAMDEMYAMGLDIDSGAKLDEVLEIVEAKNLLCFVYTSFNHGKRGIELKRDDVLRKLQITRDPEESEIRQFLREFDKNRYEETFIAECTIRDQKHQTADGVKIVLDTPPLEKFRLIFPLAEPVKLIDLAGTQQGALDLWEDKITGLARNVLGVHFDTSCTDPSRLFYTARHPKDAAEWRAVIVMGEPLRFSDVDPFKKSIYTANREVNAFTMAGGDVDKDRPPMAVTPSGASLNEWHTRFKSRFLLAELLETLCADKIVRAGNEAQGHVHVECPFEHEHTSSGGTATMAINCVDSHNEFWTMFCHHDACQGRHKLQFLEEMLRQGWFEESAIHDMDQGFVLEPEDEPEDAPEEPAEVLSGDTYKTPEERATQFTVESTDDDIRKFIKGLFREGVDLTTQSNVNAVISEHTNLGRRDVKKFWKELEEKQKERERNKAKAEKGAGDVAIVNEWDFDEQCIYANRRIHDTNQKLPKVFHYMEDLCVVRENSDGHARIRFLTKEGFAHHLNTVARFVRSSGDKASIGVSAPLDVVSHLFVADHTTYPDLRGLVTTPTFTKDGSLLTEPGYDWNSKLYYKPDNNLSVPKVMENPSNEDVYEAKRLIIDEILADFPLGALSRPEIVEQALNGDGIPAVTNMMALILLPFMREIIVGPTPGHLIVKPAPGTGASLMADVCSIIATGQVTPALAMPPNNDEMAKTLTSVLANGQAFVFFDNINHSVDSGELASAMTAPVYQARVLGKTQTVEVDVRCAWLFTGNNVTLSRELVRRLVMIDLDARLENPEMRTGFLHDDIRGWATTNRGRLVWACLTIIQNWVAQGMHHQKDVVLASYENWSGAVGGVLKAAGLGGFMGNREALKASSTDEDSDDFPLLLESWWERYGATTVPTKGDGDKVLGLVELANLENLSLPVRKEVNMDGERTFNSAGFGQYLSKYKGRVYKLEDGQEVIVSRDNKRTKRGFHWNLSPTVSAPESNVK